MKNCPIITQQFFDPKAAHVSFLAAKRISATEGDPKAALKKKKTSGRKSKGVQIWSASRFPS